jgi:DNA-binding GntR family transcriptional regulator
LVIEIKRILLFVAVARQPQEFDEKAPEASPSKKRGGVKSAPAAPAVIPEVSGGSGSSDESNGDPIISGQRVADAIRRMIHTGELDPGEQIHQESWSSQLSVSRSSLRDGLRILTMQHYLTHDPHRGYFVRKFSIQDVTELYEFRRLVERQVLETIRPATPAEIEVLKEAADRAGDAAADHNVGGVADADRELYFCIYDLSPRGFLIGEAKRLWDIAEPYRIRTMQYLFMTRDSRRLRGIGSSRQEMVRAVQAGDTKTLIKLVERQRSHVVELLSSMTSSTRS